MKRLLVVLLGALLLALAIAGGTFVFLAASESGTRFLAEQAERFLPVRFTDISGTLWGEVRLSRFELELGERVVVAEDLAVAMDLYPLLFDNRLDVAWARAASVVVGPGAEAAGNGTPPALELPFMPITLDVAELTVDRLELPGVFPMHLAASAAWLNRGVVVESLTVTSEVVNFSAAGELGRGSNPRLTARLDWSVPGTGWGGDGRLSGRVDALRVHHDLRGPVSGSARGTASLEDVTRPRVDVAVDLADLGFGDTAMGGIEGRLTGTLDDMAAQASGRVVTAAVAPFRLAVDARGPVNGPLALNRVTADALAGRQQAAGRLDWRDGISLVLTGEAEGVSAAALRDDLSGRLDAAFRLRYLDDALAVDLRDIAGTLNGHPVAGRMDVVQLPGGWLLDPLELQAGENRLTGRLALQSAGGKIPELDLAAEVTAPALGDLGLPVSGDARGSVRLAGRWPVLDGSADLQSARLTGFDGELVDARIRLGVSRGVVDGALSAAAAARGEVRVTDARLAVAGPLENVSWKLTAARGEGAGTFRRLGDGFVLGVAEARLDALAATWRLESATTLTLAGSRVELEPVCVAGADARACIAEFSYEPGRIDTRGELVRAPVALLDPWLPVRFTADGYVTGRWSVSGGPGDWQGDVALDARGLAYLADPEEPVIDLPDLRTTGVIEGETLTVRLSATDPGFSIAGEGTLQPVAGDGRLSGTITAAVADLAPLQVFDQRIERLTGGLDGRLELSGSPAAPRAQGTLELVQGSLKLNQPDLVLSEIAAAVRVDDSGRFELSGGAVQGTTGVRLTGSGSGLFDGALAFQAALDGEGIQVSHPDWDVLVSPALRMNYADGKGRLRGRVVVPEAEVRMKALPRSVPSPSEDVVVVGRESQPGNGGNPIEVDVELVLGDEVVLKALAITAELEGRVRARLDAAGSTSLRGTLDITGGELSTQGTTLAIESGTVVYNGPVTRPYIDLRAVRVIEDQIPEVTVGLHIRGDADNLTSSVFSEPPMSPTRALSFLVLGRDVDQQRSDDDGGRLLAAAINLGLSRSSGITGELKRMTGLDELSAMAEAQNSFAIVAGKRISDDLYVRYTYNTLSAVGAFLVRYDLGRRWHLEAQSGETSAMDLMYSFEK